MAPATTRTSPTGISRIFLDRWSPRAFDASAMPEKDIISILDAGRWAPSSFNYQPWMFLYARRGEPEFDKFLSLLLPFNQSWAKNASLLIFFVSETVMGVPDKPSSTHSFDTGAAWAQIALQSMFLGYHAHAMAGIEAERARSELDIPADWRIEAAAAVGRQGTLDMLPEGLRAKETPSDRKPLAQIIHHGGFPPPSRDQIAGYSMQCR